MSLAAEILADTPIAYWKMNEVSGTTLADSSGNGHDLTLAGGVARVAAPMFDGLTDTCLVCDGASTPQVAHHADFNLMNSAFTIEAIMSRPPFGPAGNQSFQIIKDDISTSWALAVTALNPSKFVFADMFANGLSSNDAGGSSLIQSIGNGTTYLVIATYDGAALKRYVNGSAAVVATPSSGSLTANTRAVKVGYLPLGASSAPAAIQHVALYDHALTTTRIDAHAAAAGSPVVGWTLANSLRNALALQFPHPSII